MTTEFDKFLTRKLEDPAIRDAYYAALAQKVIDLATEVEKWHDECDKVGIPYDPAGLVRHHRGNAALAAANWQLVAESQRDKALAEVKTLRAAQQRVRDLDLDAMAQEVCDALKITYAGGTVYAALRDVVAALDGADHD